MRSPRSDQWWNAAPPEPDTGTGGAAGAGTETVCAVPTVPGEECPVIGGEIVLELTAPASEDDVVLAATHRLEVRDRARVLGSAAPLHVVNAGDGATDIGVEAQADANVISVAPITVRDRAAVMGGVRSAHEVTIAASASVTGSVVPHDGVEVGSESWQVHFPVAPGPAVHLEPDSRDSLSPGSYGNVEVKSRATLALECGLYHFESLMVHNQAALEVECSDATPLVINVRRSVTWRGASVVGDLGASRIQLAYLGSQDVLVETPWVGTLLAPQAKVFLAPLNGGTHHGSLACVADVADTSRRSTGCHTTSGATGAAALRAIRPTSSPDSGQPFTLPGNTSTGTEASGSRHDAWSRGRNQDQYEPAGWHDQARRWWAGAPEAMLRLFAAMPEVSRFFGIVIRMYFDDHAPPHFHASYQGSDVEIGVDFLGVRAGRLPPRALALVVE